MLEMLLERNETEVNITDANRRTPLQRAAAMGQVDAVSALLRHPKIDIDGTRGSATALHLAVRAGHIKAVAILLHRVQESVNYRDAYGKYLLQTAVCSGAHDMVAVLLQDARVDVQVQDRHGATLLQFAAQHEHLNVVDLLLKHPRFDSAERNCSI